MKSIIVIILAILFSFTANATDIKREGTTFVAEKTINKESSYVKTDYTYVDTKGVSYSIYVHQIKTGDNAGRWCAYIQKTSTKSGNEYMYKLQNGYEIAEQIVKELNIE